MKSLTPGEYVLVATPDGSVFRVAKSDLGVSSLELVARDKAVRGMNGIKGGTNTRGTRGAAIEAVEGGVKKAADVAEGTATANKSTSKNPNGYSKGDVDQHKYLSPHKNRAPGNKNIAADSNVQSHHVIQHEWAKNNVSGYKKGDAPAILIETGMGKPHTSITNSQRARRAESGYSTTIKEEFNAGYRELIEAGVSQKQARKGIKQSYKYYDNLGAFN